jgi:hypothetical protein
MGRSSKPGQHLSYVQIRIEGARIHHARMPAIGSCLVAWSRRHVPLSCAVPEHRRAGPKFAGSMRLCWRMVG